MPRESIHDGFSRLIRVTRGAWPTLAALHPASELCVAAAGSGAAGGFDGSEQGSDVDFLVTMRTFHATNLRHPGFDFPPKNQRTVIS